MKPMHLIKVDIISNLPVELLDAILVKLPLKDAVRTSILSRKWRDKWVTISELVFNDSYAPSTLGEDATVKKLKFVSHVDQILLRHQGCLQKFALCSRLPILSHLDRWIICLSRKCVKELIIDCGCWPYEVSSRIFYCQDIISLELHNCFVTSPPPSFEVFPNLKHLGIYGGMTLTRDVQNISIMISKCPRLERLTFKPLCATSIKINAQCLKFLDLSRKVMYVHFEHAPILCEISIGELNSNRMKPVVMDYNNLMKPVVTDYNFLLSLCHLPYIRKLTLGTKPMLGWPDRFEPKRLPTALCNLENLSVCINFENNIDILGLLCLLRSSSGLMKLSLWTLPTMGICHRKKFEAAGYWKAEKDLNCWLHNLLEVCITGVRDLAPELEFIKVLLANSPVLQKITFAESHGNDKIFKELLQFKRASTDADFFFI